MENKAEIIERASEEIKKRAAKRAAARARIARWDLDVAIFLFVVLILVIVLLFQGIGIEIVAPVALFGLVIVWLVGWRRGKKLYEGFYDEELGRLERELAEKEEKAKKGEKARKVEERIEKTIEETIEEKVQRALRERWR